MESLSQVDFLVSLLGRSSLEALLLQYLATLSPLGLQGAQSLLTVRFQL